MRSLNVPPGSPALIGPSPVDGLLLSCKFQSIHLSWQ